MDHKYLNYKRINGIIGSTVLLLLFLITPFNVTSCSQEGSIEFSIKFDKDFSDTPITGRAFIILDSDTTQEPRQGYPWYSKTGYYFAINFSDMTPEDDIIIDHNSVSYPKKITELDTGFYAVQAVLDINTTEKHFSLATGNGYSDVAIIQLQGNVPQRVDLVVDNVVPEKGFPESEFVKEAILTSQLLSNFYDYPTKMRAAIYLPDSYYELTDKHYPVVYVIPSFNTRHNQIEKNKNRHIVRDGIDKIFIVLDPDCHNGHHSFADSENNGPRARALVEEFIPYIENVYRIITKPEARFLSGHSSGGWSCLWLQIIYPDYFGGVWSTAPGPVDFRSYYRVNVYNDYNFLFDSDSQEIPFWRRSEDEVYKTQKYFSDVGQILKHGGVFTSNESVYSPKDRDGQIKNLFNRETGVIDHEVSEAWKKYDIRIVLRNGWDTLGPRLQGKIHIYAKERDSFYQNEHIVLLKEDLVQLGSDAVIELIEGFGHGAVLKDVGDRINSEMDSALLRAFPDL